MRAEIYSLSKPKTMYEVIVRAYKPNEQVVTTHLHSFLSRRKYKNKILLSNGDAKFYVNRADLIE